MKSLFYSVFDFNSTESIHALHVTSRKGRTGPRAMLVVDFTPRGRAYQGVGCRELPGRTIFSKKVPSLWYANLEKRADLYNDCVQLVRAEFFGVSAIAAATKFWREGVSFQQKKKASLHATKFDEWF